MSTDRTGAAPKSVASRRTLCKMLPSLLVACSTTAGAQVEGNTKPNVRTGAAQLAADGCATLAGRRVGLLTNHTGRVGTERLIDVLARAKGVTLAAILTPEHGLSGTAEAGAKVSDGIDAATGVRVHSLYGSGYKPTREMLAGLDVLVFDMQDIGTRFYTYISTMGLAMQAAAAAGLPFLVLDRPNPLGGDYVSGFVLEKPFASFVGRFEIPIAHGLTAGELAGMIKGERLLSGLDGLALEVAAMQGWRRQMRWPATGLTWIATSPNIPSFETALAYAGTGLFEATVASEGRGTPEPFLLLGHPAIEGAAVADRVNRSALPGVRIEPRRFRPRALPGVATNPRFRDRDIPGVRLVITDADAFAPVETGVHLLAAFAEALRAKGEAPLVNDTKPFNRLAGTGRLAAAIDRGAMADGIVESWSAEVARFRARRARYLLY
ncbi:MAG: DUF1343 domain-containing protein [Hyphomicrobiaceae bacterium]|nr:DUF1343 domain-containing protein [Hyphomicrobiaceae bacterium]